MAYTDRTIRLSFDGSNENYPCLGEDIWVVIMNPMLMPGSRLRSSTQVQTDANGNPVDPEAAVDATMEMCARLIIDWNVYDPEDFSETPDVLPLPATVETMNKIPIVITNAIGDFVTKALNPR